MDQSVSPGRRTLPSRYLFARPTPPRHAVLTVLLRRPVVTLSVTLPASLTVLALLALLLPADPLGRPFGVAGPGDGTGPAPHGLGTAAAETPPRSTMWPTPATDRTSGPVGERPGEHLAPAPPGPGSSARPPRPGTARTGTTTARSGRGGSTRLDPAPQTGREIGRAPDPATKTSTGTRTTTTAGSPIATTPRSDAAWIEHECARRFPHDPVRRGACAGALAGFTGGP